MRSLRKTAAAPPVETIVPETTNVSGKPEFSGRLFTPVSGASLAVFRIALGFVMLLEAFTLTQPIGSVAGGLTQLQNYYTGPDIAYRFPYPGFGWLPLFGPDALKLLVGLMGLAAISMAAGFLYRLSATIVFLVWGYFYAVESTRTYWMSYYYLELLITFLMIWLPAARCYSVDAMLKKSPPLNRLIPTWPLVLLRGQLVITYFYAGVAKLNADWMLDAMPVRYFLAQPHVVSKLQSFPALASSPALALGLSWAGAIFDLLVGFLLLIRRTRILGLVLMFIFHGTNHFILFTDIVWFPLVGVLTALIFLDPDWPQRLAAWLRKPAFKKPDWPWLGAGAIAVPVVGATLGWSLQPSKIKPAVPFPPQRWVTFFVLGWLGWQSVFPARHYLIPGDVRMTFEGLSFSWRLKAEVYRAQPAELFVADAQFISRNNEGQTQVNWSAWSGERVIYRSVDVQNLNWKTLPELVVVFEPALGERVIYNPFAGIETPRNEDEARARAVELWQSSYGRAPKTLRRTTSLSEILDGYTAAIRARGGTVPADRSNLLATMIQMHGREGDRQMLPFLRRMHPFTLDNHSAPAGPFLLLEDDALLNSSSAQTLELDRDRWKPVFPPDGARQTHTNGRPLIVYTVLKPEIRAALPEMCIIDSQNEPQKPPIISWDYRRDLTLSKQMHISTQPFLLREYARRIADEWEKLHGRRPKVHANTFLSLNLRPPQAFVDPSADLASARRKYFGHNEWIRDLDLPRIPRENIQAEFNRP